MSRKEVIVILSLILILFFGLKYLTNLINRADGGVCAREYKDYVKNLNNDIMRKQYQEIYENCIRKNVKEQK